MIHEINSPDWPAFCRCITQERVDALVKIEVIGSDGIKTEKIDGAAFQSMVFRTDNACSNIITLRVRNTHEFVHEILEPIHIKLHRTASPNDFNPIQIEAESGITIITLHPAVHAQMLEHLKTADAQK